MANHQIYRVRQKRARWEAAGIVMFAFALLVTGLRLSFVLRIFVLATNDDEVEAASRLNWSQFNGVKEAQRS